MAKQHRKKTRPSWFQKQVEKNGRDFLLRKPPHEIQRESLNIVRDIIRGNITKNDFEYLFDMKILSNVKLSIYDKFSELYIYNSSMMFAIGSQYGIQPLINNFNVNPEKFEQVFNSTKDKLYAYNAVLHSLETMINFVQSPMPKAEEDYFQIYSTIYYQLSNFKYII